MAWAWHVAIPELYVRQRWRPFGYTGSTAVYCSTGGQYSDAPVSVAFGKGPPDLCPCASASLNLIAPGMETLAHLFHVLERPKI